MQSEVLKLSSDVLQFMSGMEMLETPNALLDDLHEATYSVPSLNVLGAARFPIRWGEWSDGYYRLGLPLISKKILRSSRHA